MTGISSRAHRCAVSLEDDDASRPEHTQMVFLEVAVGMERFEPLKFPGSQP
jgi:hypothetical protein